MGYLIQSSLVVSRFNWGLASSFRYQWNDKTSQGNIELTAPYMHDGSLKNIEAVIEYYSSGATIILTKMT